MGLYKGTTLVAGLAKNTIVTGFNIFDVKWSDHIINDIQWLRADTFSWQSGDVYVTAYNKLVEEYSTGTTETEGSVTFKRTTNGYKIADATQETAISNKYNTDGIAWYYILDTTNKCFKLPRTKFGFEGLRNTVGSDIAESLPNIRGSFASNFTISKDDSSDGIGAIQTPYDTSSGRYGTGTAGAEFGHGFNFDASRSSSVYQDNANVQERATQMYLYFYVGEYSREAIEQTAGITSEQLNNKVDTSSLSEINPMIESFVDGTSGYNIWANGYCEQWGFKDTTNTSITFLKKFKDINYNLLGVGFYMSGMGRQAVAKRVDGFTTSSDVRASGTDSWRACGYLAEGEY